MKKTLLGYVLGELQARKGSWRDIAKAKSPQGWESYYSWLQKVASGAIPDPGVKKIQSLADWLREKS